LRAADRAGSNSNKFSALGLCSFPSHEEPTAKKSTSACAVLGDEEMIRSLKCLPVSRTKVRSFGLQWKCNKSETEDKSILVDFNTVVGQDLIWRLLTNLRTTCTSFVLEVATQCSKQVKVSKILTVLFCTSLCLWSAKALLHVATIGNSPEAIRAQLDP
jgi:hypothetical protein